MIKLMVTVFLASTLALGQAKPAAKARNSSAPKQGTSAKAGSAAPALPSMAETKAFLHHVFGWDPDVKITVQDIKPSPAPGIAEIDVHAEMPKGTGNSSIFVTADGKHAISGQMLPFGGSPGQRPTNAQVDAFLTRMTASNPGIIWNVDRIKADAAANLTEVVVILTNPQGQHGLQRFYVTADGEHALIGDLGPFGADPFAANRALLAREVDGPWEGSATPKVTIVEFGDLECPSCKAAAPTVTRLAKEVPEAKVIFEQFPLITIHHWALTAAKFGNCIARQNNSDFWRFLRAVYAEQEDISSHVETGDPSKKPDLAYAEEKLTAIAAQLGLNGKQIAQCAATKETEARVQRSMDLGNKMEVTSTPTLFVNGRRVTTVNSMPFDALKKMVEFAATPAGK